MGIPACDAIFDPVATQGPRPGHGDLGQDVPDHEPCPAQFSVWMPQPKALALKPAGPPEKRGLIRTTSLT